jgi:hypothetical protein
MLDTAKTTLQLHDVLSETYTRHKEKLDAEHVIGMVCQDPDTAPVGKHRRNFFLWLCEEYHVRNGQSLWLDLQPEHAPAWVRKVLAYIADGYTEDSELLVHVNW